MEIYYTRNNQKVGPVPVVEIISMLERGDLEEDTPAWHVGCSEWLTLRQLPALTTYFESRKQTESDDLVLQEKDEEVGTKEVSEETSKSEDVIYLASPIARLISKSVDLSLYALGYIWLATRCLDQFEPWILMAPVLWLPFIFPEALCITWLRTTPGKWLMGLRVAKQDGTPLSFLRVLQRSFYVIFFGMGIVTTIFSPLMLALSAWYTSKFGRFSPWDVRLGTIVEEVKPLRITRIILSLIVIAIAMNETAKLLEPWLESMRMYLEQM